MIIHFFKSISVYLLISFNVVSIVIAQPDRGQGPRVTSPEVNEDKSVTFRILASKAEEVRLSGSDIPNLGPGAALTKGEEGVWEVKVGPLEPGAYRYHFNVDGVNVVDPRSPSISESNENVWSLVYVPGAEFMDTQDVPHGAVATVTYHSKTLNAVRRMHVYTPPGYETSNVMYPVFYLLHGAFDCDHSWSSVGRAGFIMDNLIAVKKAKPMIVVMPDGHTGAFEFGRGGLPMEDFENDFVSDIKPYIEKNYRTVNERGSRAIAGLSMGGAHTIDIAFPNLQDYAYIGVYSSGIFGINGGQGGNQGPSFEEKHKEILDKAELKNGLKLVWFATGKDDFLIDTTKATVDMFKKHKFDVDFKETEGGHTWKNWREYLNEFAPKLFQ